MAQPALNIAGAALKGFTIRANQAAVAAVPITTDGPSYVKALDQIMDENNAVESAAFKEIQMAKFMMNPQKWSTERSLALSKMAQKVYNSCYTKMTLLQASKVPVNKAKAIVKRYFDAQYAEELELLNTEYPISSSGEWLLKSEATNTVIDHAKEK